MTEADGGRDAERLSAFMDGELGAESPEGLIRACEAGGDLAADWSAYHCIGDVLRSADMACHSERLTQRISLRLRDEPVVVAPVTRPKAGLGRWRGHAGRFAAVAAVAVVGGLMVPRWSAIQEPATSAMLAAPPNLSAPGGPSTAPEAILRSEPAVPQAGTIPREYFVAHRQVAGSLAMQGVVSRVRSVSHETGR